MIYLTQNDNATLFTLDDFASNNPLSMLSVGDTFSFLKRDEKGTQQALSIEMLSEGFRLSQATTYDGALVMGGIGGGDFDGLSPIDWFLQHSSFKVEHYYRDGRLVNRVYDLLNATPEPNMFVTFTIEPGPGLKFEISGEWVSYEVKVTSSCAASSDGSGMKTRQFALELMSDS